MILKTIVLPSSVDYFGHNTYTGLSRPRRNIRPEHICRIHAVVRAISKILDRRSDLGRIEKFSVLTRAKQEITSTDLLRHLNICTRYIVDILWVDDIFTSTL